jgi:hypothetical protein
MCCFMTYGIETEPIHQLYFVAFHIKGLQSASIVGDFTMNYISICSKN